MMLPLTRSLKQLIPLSAPLLVAKLGIPLRGFVITWIFAKVSPEVLAAGGLTYSLLMAMLTFFLGLLMSSVGVSVAYATGANDTIAARNVLHQGFWLGIFLAIPGMLLLYNIAPILLFLGQNKTIVILAAAFSRGLAWIFIPYTVLVNAYKLWTNLKKTYIPMFYSFLGLFITVIISYTLALGKLGFTAKGIAGVGWGIAIAYWIQAIIILLHLHLSPLTKYYSFFSKMAWPKKIELIALWRIGWPVGLKCTVEFFLFFVIAAIIGASSHNNLAVYQVILQFFMLSSCLSSGVGLGTEALVGQAIGGGRYSLVKPACMAGLLLATFYIGLVIVITILFPEWIAHSFFITGTITFLLFVQSIVWIVIFQLLDGLRKVMTAILVTFKDSRFPLLAELIGLWGISLPLGYGIGAGCHRGLDGFLMSLVIGLFVSVVLMIYRFHSRMKTFY